MVGHSIGGLFTRLYAQRYPDDIAGMVLIDASHEMQDVRRQSMVSSSMFAAEQHAVASNVEGIDLPTSFTQVVEARVATPLNPMPIVVLSAGELDPAFFPPDWPMDAEAQLHSELQADLAGLVPGGRLIVAELSGHYIQQTQPKLVVEAILAVVRAVIDPATWS